MYEDDEDDQDWYEVEPVESEELFTIPCPHCGAEIFEDSPRCPACGDYPTSTRRNFGEGKPVWYAVLAFLGILAVIAACLLVF